MPHKSPARPSPPESALRENPAPTAAVLPMGRSGSERPRSDEESAWKAAVSDGLSAKPSRAKGAQLTAKSGSLRASSQHIRERLAELIEPGVAGHEYD